MKYTCDQCQKEVDDNGPYELKNGECQCQGCLENQIAQAEATIEK